MPRTPSWLHDLQWVLVDVISCVGTVVWAPSSSNTAATADKKSKVILVVPSYRVLEYCFFYCTTSWLLLTVPAMKRYYLYMSYEWNIYDCNGQPSSLHLERSMNDLLTTVLRGLLLDDPEVSQRRDAPTIVLYQVPCEFFLLTKIEAPQDNFLHCETQASQI